MSAIYGSTNLYKFTVCRIFSMYRLIRLALINTSPNPPNLRPCRHATRGSQPSEALMLFRDLGLYLSSSGAIFRVVIVEDATSGRGFLHLGGSAEDV